MHGRLRAGGRAWMLRLPVLAAILALPGAAHAALPANTLTSFSEAWAIPTEKTLKKDLATVPRQCPKPAASAAQLPPGVELPPGITLPPGVTIPTIPTAPTKTAKPRKLRKPSFAVAMRRARALARSGKAGRLMTRLARPLRTEADTHEFAVASVLGGSPRLALGGLLVANSRDPRDGMNLVNAAVPLALLGKPAEALALLDRAAGRSARSSALRGAARGVLENNRGYALLKLGRPAEAIAPLRRAIAVAGRPLAEAHANLALALVCSGGSGDEAVKLIRQSYARRGLEYLTSRGQPGGILDLPEFPRASQVYDLDDGRDTPLPQFRWPSTPEQSSQSVERMAAINAASSAKLGEINARLQPATERVNALKEPLVEKLRRSWLANAVNQSNDEPELGPLHDRVLAAFQDVGTHTDAFWSATVPKKQQECLQSGDFEACFIPWCQSATASAQGGFNSRMALLDQLAREYWQKAGRRESGIVANLEQPDYHAMALANMQAHGEAIWGLVATAPVAWIGATFLLKDLCVAGQEPPPDSPAVAANVEDPGACPRALQNMSASYSTGVDIPPARGDGRPKTVSVGLKVGCDKAEVELSRSVSGTGELLSVFGRGEADFRKDEVTMVVGVKGSVVGVLAGQSGFYVKTGKDGVKDFGWRTGASASVGPLGALGGAGRIKVWGGTEDISLVGSIDYIPTALGLR